MRERYHIKIAGEHVAEFERIITQLGVVSKFTCGVRENNQILENDYIVELSKYELLYIRLACQSGQIINLKSEVW